MNHQDGNTMLDRIFEVAIKREWVEQGTCSRFMKTAQIRVDVDVRCPQGIHRRHRCSVGRGRKGVRSDFDRVKTTKAERDRIQ